MKTPNRVIERLYDRAGGWWALEELARDCGISPSRLDSALSQLRQRGHEFDYAPTMGIRLRRPAGLDAHLIERSLPVRRVGRNVICFAELDSTNDTAAACARQEHSDGLVVLADAQRKGRGRHGRRWLSPPGANVLMSALLNEAGGPLPREALTVAAGLAAAEAIEELHGLHAALKWPNDVLLDGRKVCGVLVERRLDGPCLIVGVGVNVNAHPPASAVDRPATSLAANLPGPVERIELVRALLRRLDEWVVRLGQEPSAAVETLREAWRHRCPMLNERVTLVSGGRRHTGRVIDIDPLAGLVLLTDEGLQLRLPAERTTIA